MEIASFALWAGGEEGADPFKLHVSSDGRNHEPLATTRRQTTYSSHRCNRRNPRKVAG